MKTLRKMTSLLLAVSLIMSTALIASAQETEKVHKIVLSSTQTGSGYTHSATVDGISVPEYDYTWHADPSTVHEEVKHSPAEYYTGTKPTGEDAVYIAHDIYYYPELDENKFQKVNYDGETEWAYFYEAEGYENYIFSTLPVQNTGFPSHMMHSPEEAYNNAVLHINEAGTYIIEGEWNGQIWIDLGDEDDVFANENEKVTLIFNGADVTCTVAPAVVFASVYESDHAWEDRDNYSQSVDTQNAGANVIIADGTTNNISGTNIYRILKTNYKDEDSSEQYPAQKKRLKLDGTLYSYQSMNINGGVEGTGILNINSGFEGLNTELHLTMNGGHVNIYSQDDGINVNEDGVSVLTVNGGNLHISAGLGSEGDGIDSNGYLVINGGTVISAANPKADSGLDSDFGSFVNGGTVVALGSTMDWAKADDTSDSMQPVLNLQFSGSQNSDEAIIITDLDGNVKFAYDPDKDEVTGSNLRTYRGAIVSSANLQIGNSYQIHIGGDLEGDEVSGVYDVATITSFSGATLQSYSGNTLGGHGGGNMGDFAPGNGMEPPDMSNFMPPPNDGNFDFTPPEGIGGEKPDIPNQDNLGNMIPPEGMENMTPPNNAGGSNQGMNQATNVGDTCTFTLTDKVNAFASVYDHEHNIVKVEAVEAEYGKSGHIQHYACTGCGTLYADAEGSIVLTAEDVEIPSKDYTLLIFANFTLAATLLAACAVGIVLIMKRNKKSNNV